MTDATSHTLLALAQLHYQDLQRQLTRRLGCAAQAADLVQDLCVRLREMGGRAPESGQESDPESGHESGDTGGNTGGGGATAAIRNPRAYLFRMADNLATDHQRRARALERHVSPAPLPEMLPSAAPAADEVLYQRERLAMLRAAIDALPPRCREVFLLYRFAGLSQQEIAHRLGISVSMVEKHVQRAMQQCCDRLRQSDA